jgi:hypothetical protein
VYVEVTTDNMNPTFHALDALTGEVLWFTSMGNRLFSHPQNGAGDDVLISSISGQTIALICPPNAQFSVDRLVYVCPELTLVEPTQQDLCNELLNPCDPIAPMNTLVVPSFFH